MYLSKTASGIRYNLFNYSRRFFAVKEYDLAVIGGGPGGKLITKSII